MKKSVYVFGDSVAKGVVLDETNDKYKFFSEEYLNKFAEDNELEIHNYARFGCTITKGIKLFEQKLNELDGCDYIVLEFGGNDCNFNWNEISKSPDEIHLPKTPLDEFNEEYEKLADMARAHCKQLVILNLPPIESDKFFCWFARGNNQYNILKWLGKVENIFKWQKNYNDAVVEIAKKKKLPLIDIRAAFPEGIKLRNLICKDGMHPNEEGHKKIIERLYMFVRRPVQI